MDEIHQRNYFFRFQARHIKEYSETKVFFTKLQTKSMSMEGHSMVFSLFKKLQTK